MHPHPASPPVPGTPSDFVPDIPFTPVPSARTRHDGWTPERQRGFVEQLARIGMVSAAARAVGMSAKSAYGLRKRADAESFAAAWDTALEQGRAHARDLAIDRALNGTATPILYRGRHVGVRQVFDNRLLIATLRLVPQRAPDALSLHDAIAALSANPVAGEPE